MTAPTHILTGLASIVVVGRLTGISPDAVSLLVFIVGTLAPDIDGNGSITRPGTILRGHPRADGIYSDVDKGEPAAMPHSHASVQATCHGRTAHS